MTETVSRWDTGVPICEGPTVREACERHVAAGGSLARANLTDANLTGAKLRYAELAGADLMGANLTGANLRYAKLTGANLTGATMPDGRVWEVYRLDPLAGICHTNEARARAKAAQGHTWRDCPMYEGLGYTSIDNAPAGEHRDVAAFVAVYDARLLGQDWRTA